MAAKRRGTMGESLLTYVPSAEDLERAVGIMTGADAKRAKSQKKQFATIRVAARDEGAGGADHEGDWRVEDGVYQKISRVPAREVSWHVEDL